MKDDENTKNWNYASLLEVKDNHEKWMINLDEIQYPILEEESSMSGLGVEKIFVG